MSKDIIDHTDLDWITDKNGVKRVITHENYDAFGIQKVQAEPMLASMFGEFKVYMMLRILGDPSYSTGKLIRHHSKDTLVTPYEKKKLNVAVEAQRMDIVGCEGLVNDITYREKRPWPRRVFWKPWKKYKVRVVSSPDPNVYQYKNDVYMAHPQTIIYLLGLLQEGISTDAEK